MKLGVGISGSLRQILDGETILAAHAIRRGVEAAGGEVQEELRAQVRSAGFRGGGRKVANAWRLKVYPRGGIATLHPSALVYTQAPDIVDAFEQGRPIVVKRKRWLCWPTGFNAAGGRRGAGGRGGVKVTPAEMVASREAVILRVKSNPNLRLWCLRVREARGITRRTRNQVRLFVGGKNVEVNTGRRKLAERNEAAAKLLERGVVAMFFLARQTSPRKRLDVAGTARRAEGVLASRVSGELGR